jgi:hypothetical protein
LAKLPVWTAKNADKYPENVEALCGDSTATILRYFGFSTFFKQSRLWLDGNLMSRLKNAPRSELLTSGNPILPGLNQVRLASSGFSTNDWRVRAVRLSRYAVSDDSLTHAYRAIAAPIQPRRHQFLRILFKAAAPRRSKPQNGTTSSYPRPSTLTNRAELQASLMLLSPWYVVPL